MRQLFSFLSPSTVPMSLAPVPPVEASFDFMGEGADLAEEK